MLQIDYSPPSGPSGHESQTWRSLKYRDSRLQVVPWCCAGLLAPHVWPQGLLGKKIHDMLIAHDRRIISAPHPWRSDVSRKRAVLPIIHVGFLWFLMRCASLRVCFMGSRSFLYMTIVTRRGFVPSFPFPFKFDGMSRFRLH